MNKCDIDENDVFLDRYVSKEEHDSAVKAVVDSGGECSAEQRKIIDTYIKQWHDSLDKKMKIKAFGNNVVVQAEEVVNKVGSIIIPDSASKKNIRTRNGTVLGLGETGTFEVKIGDKIIYDRLSEMETDSYNVVIIPHSSILIYGR